MQIGLPRLLDLVRDVQAPSIVRIPFHLRIFAACQIMAEPPDVVHYRHERESILGGLPRSERRPGRPRSTEAYLGTNVFSQNL